MPNPFFNALNSTPAVQNGPNILQMVQQFKANPLSFILQKRLNIPTNMVNNPEAMLNYLVSTRQVSQEQINAAKQQMSTMSFRN